VTRNRRPARQTGCPKLLVVVTRAHQAATKAREWNGTEGASDEHVSTFERSCCLDRHEVRIAYCPQLAPSLEPDLEEVRVHALRRIDPNHAVDEAATPSVLARAIEIARGVTGRPHTLGAVLAPREHRSSCDGSSELGEVRQDIRRNLTGGLDAAVHFGSYMGAVIGRTHRNRRRRFAQRVAMNRPRVAGRLRRPDPAFRLPRDARAGRSTEKSSKERTIVSRTGSCAGLLSGWL